MICAAMSALTLASCGPVTQSSEDIQNNQQEQANKQAVQTVGFPNIVNWQEKRTLKQIYELRDTALRTYAYTQDLNGRYHKLCDSIGYGIPNSTQFTNPNQVVAGYYRENSDVIAQADPNGLYSSQSSGTWVLCKDPNSDKNMPVYVEPNVIVSPFPLTQG